MEQHITELIALGPQVHWGLPIIQDIFFTGLSAGAFFLAALVYGFGEHRLLPVVRLSLIVSLASVLTALPNLIADLGQPGRFYSLLYRLDATSPMTWGVFLLNGFLLLLLVLMLVVFRSGFVRRANSADNSMRGLYRLLAFNRRQATAETEESDRRLSRILVLLALPLALCMHAYSGYILGAVKANPLWHNPLLPAIFVAAALVSGIGLMILLSGLMVRNSEGRIPWPVMDRLGLFLAWSLAFELILRLLWYSIGIAYSGGAAGEGGKLLFKSGLLATWPELTLGVLLPLLVMGVPALRRVRPFFFLSALLAVIGVLVYRWDTVIGGQLLPKFGAGFYRYSPQFWGRTGIMHIIGNWGLWLFLIISLTSLCPWQREEESSQRIIKTTADTAAVQ